MREIYQHYQCVGYFKTCAGAYNMYNRQGYKLFSQKLQHLVYQISKLRNIWKEDTKTSFKTKMYVGTGIISYDLLKQRISIFDHKDSAGHTVVLQCVVLDKFSKHTVFILNDKLRPADHQTSKTVKFSNQFLLHKDS